MGERPQLSHDRPTGVFRHVAHPTHRHLRLVFTPTRSGQLGLLTLLFPLHLDAARTVQPALLPFTSQLSPFAAYYLTYPYWHAILSRVYRSSSSPKCSLCIPNESAGRRPC